MAETPFSFQVGAGYRQDTLNWNIGSPSGHPNVLSELSWTDLRMVDYHAQFIYNPRCPFYARVSGDYATIYNGIVQDSDWTGDNRTKEITRSYGDAGDGEAFDIAAVIGYKRIYLHNITLIPVIGYMQQEQHLRFSDGNLVIDKVDNNIGPFEGLHSNYRARWYSPLIGLDFNAKPSSCFYVYGTIDALLSYYSGTGHWNLRSDILDDFKHQAWGYGFVFQLGVDWNVHSCFSIGLLGEYQTHWTRSGWDKTHALIENEEVSVRQPLNGVNWRTSRILGTATYKW